MQYLNLGCGNRYKPGWINIDFASRSPDVLSHDLKAGIPMPEKSVDVVYHSHVLEHFSRENAEFFLEECYRVLRSSGIIRVVVPDLENIVREYLSVLDSINSGSSELNANHEWIVIEMLDQMVRRSSGGEMLNYLSKEKLENKQFIIRRMGTEISNIIESRKIPKPSYSRINWSLKSFLQQVKCFLTTPSYRKELFLRSFLNEEEYYKLQIGRFIESGEIHQWMYDSIALTDLLKKVGFIQILKRNAYDSYIGTWSEFNLDTESDGSVYKPQSLYMEAIKP